MRPPYSCRAIPVVAVLVAALALLAVPVAAFDLPPLSLSAVQGVGAGAVTGTGLSLPLGQWVTVSNVAPWLDVGVRLEEGIHVKGWYGGLSGSLAGRVPLLGKTRQGIGYSAPGGWFLYAALEF
jgi:hypothetical protein